MVNLRYFRKTNNWLVHFTIHSRRFTLLLIRLFPAQKKLCNAGLPAFLRIFYREKKMVLATAKHKDSGKK